MQSSAEIVEAIHKLCASAPDGRPTDLAPGKYTSGQPEWSRLEHTAWSLGEQVRQALARNPKLRTKPEILEAIVQVVECESLRRGRQSFALCLAFVGAKPTAARLSPYLGDKDVCGHVLRALIGMRAPGYTSEVAQLRAAEHAWIRNLAKKYLERYQNTA
jgi:hypothetical protein